MASVVSYTNGQMHYAHSIDDNLKSEDYQLHCHSYYEIYYFIAGDVSYLVEGKLYKPAPHSLLLLPCKYFHGVKIESEKTYERFTLHFREDVIPKENRQLLLSVFSGGELYYQNVDEYRIPAYFNNLEDCAIMPDPLRQTAIVAKVQSLLAHMLFMAQSSNSSTPSESISQTVSRLISYLNSHFTEAVTLDDISARFFISKHHLNKVFRKATGTTVGEYIIHKRVIAAQQMIQNGTAATQAAIASGFNDYSVFYRAYRRILGHSPVREREVALS